MKRIRLFNYIALIFIVASFLGCPAKNNPEPDPHNNSTNLDGYWSNGEIVIYIYGSEGTFYEINSGEWTKPYNQGFIDIGSQKFRYLAKLKDDEFFSGQELWYYQENQIVKQLAWSETGEFNLRNDGNTLYVNTKDPWSSLWSHVEYTRIYP
jgi:hypothetical protein